VWFNELPVNALISPQCLKAWGWKTSLEPDGDFLVNLKSETTISMEQSTSNLLQFNLHFGEFGLMVDSSFLQGESVDSHLLVPRKHRRALRIRGKVPSLKKIVKSDPSVTRKKKTTQLLEHWRSCHFSEGNSRTPCLDCMEYKGQKKGHSVVREERYAIAEPLTLFACDFFGMVKPVSYKGNNWVFVFVCDTCGYLHVKPLKTKHDAPKELEKFVLSLRNKCGIPFGSNANKKGQIIFQGIRSDNEPVLTSTDWKETCQKMNILETHSVPFEPQMNGKVERMIQTLKASLRTTMANIDPRVWDYAVSHIATVWNMRNNTASTNILEKPSSPDNIVASRSECPFVGISSKQQYLRRFGCLTFFVPGSRLKDKIKEEKKNGPLLPKKRKGIHLGF